MKIKIYVRTEYKTNDLKTFKTNSKIWVSMTSENRIMFSHRFKIYAKNFNCTRSELKKIISIVKKMNQGTIKNKTI